ncbi:efflux transporter outer membrane subunit [Erythrobacter rubeus]|uniref:Efflux transporter outer membrane subunit n=1 Tax=Erythrobacter rubeus TaxID=2760803 RepID=A0ABR8KK90_9SPHN|nr:efflux transporter outer membrane subunit [Erythrobacter rubeus]MBD2840653.1 efflux transporter outer membrane subunit [Erythrobacter rubeus]
MRHLIALSLPVLLGACVAGPPPEIATPTPELPGEFFFSGDEDVVSTVAALLPQDDPAFETLAADALRDGPSLAEAVARIEAARAGARQAGAERLPNVSVDGAVTGTRINPNQFGDGAAQGGFIDTEQVSYGANLVASWDADLFGRLKAQERAAIARIDGASASANAVRIALLAEIAGSVIDWRVLSARGEALQQDVDAALQLASLAKTREDAGIAPGFDRVRAEAAASASRSRLAALESERVRIVGRLITLTGQSGAQVATALAQPGISLDPAPAPLALPSDLLANRPDVLAAASELTATDAELAAAARARFPRLTLSAVVGLLAFSPGDFFEEDSIVGTLTAGLAAPLLDFGRIEAEIDGAAANKRIAFAAYRGAVFQALGDAEAAYGLIDAADTEAALAVQERDELARAASLANTRFRAGLANFLEVLEARRAADASGERAAAALGRAERARVLLWQALGGTPSESEAEG